MANNPIVPNSDLPVPLPSMHTERNGSMILPRFQWTRAVLADVESYASRGLNDRQIAAMVGISPENFSVHKKKNPDIQRCIDRGLSRSIDKIGASVVKKAIKGSFQHQKLFLEAKGEWNPKSSEQVAINVNAGPGNLTIQFIQAGEEPAKKESEQVIDEQE